MLNTHPLTRQEPAARAAPAMPQVRDEAAARLILRRNRMLANGLLAAMAAIFALTWLEPHPGYGLAWLRAASEAGIVGGLADWFAVTALFRRPLGLPIPHTAVLPRSKERMARALASFVETSFLTPEALTPRVRAAKPGARLAAWLARPANAPLLVDPVIEALPAVIRGLDDPQLRDFLSRLLGERLRELELAPLFGRALQVLARTGEADVLLDKAIAAGLLWIEGHEAEIEQLVDERRRWWLPKMFSRGIAHEIMSGLADVLTRLADHESDARARLREAIAALAERLLHAPEQAAALNGVRDRLIDHPELQTWIHSVWREIAQSLTDDLSAAEPRTRAMLEAAIVALGRTLLEDPPIQAAIDAFAERAAARLLEHRGGVARYMIEVIRGWDAETLSRRFELVIGGDLQYIRMNGTIVGSIVGSALFIATHL